MTISLSSPKLPCRIFYGFILLFLSFTSAFSQSVVVDGFIHDLQTQEPLIGATIQQEGSGNGTVTDAKGYFSLETHQNETLIISYLGYQTLRVKGAAGKSLKIKLEPDNLLLNEIQVIGYDNSKKLLETAGSIGLTTQKDLNRANSYTLQPVLNTIPGVRVDQSYLSDTRISIRGVGARSPFGNRNLKFYLNEIPLTEADGFTRIEGLDVSTLGRVEVIKGPASSIYGAGLGGVLNFQLARSPYGETSIEGSGLVGSYGLWRTGTTFKTGTDKMNLTASYGYQNYDGYREHSEDVRQFVTAFGQFFINDKQTLSFLINRTSQDSQIPGSLTPEEEAEDPRQAQASNVAQQAARDQVWTRLGISHEYAFNSYLSNITSFYTSSYTLDHPLAFAYLRNFLQGYGGRTRFVFTPNMTVLTTKFIVGGEYLNNRVDASRFQNLGGEIGTIQRDQESDNTQFTLFYQSETKLANELSLSAGVSLNKVNYKTRDLLNPVVVQGDTAIREVERDFDLNFSPRIALLYSPTTEMSIHASVSRGFSPPTSGETLNIDGSVNNAVDAETGTNYEVGVKGLALSRRLNYDLALFYLKTNNELVPQAVTPFQSIFINAGETDRLGFEASLSYLILNEESGLLKTARVFGSYAYSDFEFDTFQTFGTEGEVTNDFSGNDLTGIAPHAFNLGVDVVSHTGLYFYGTLLFNDAFPVNDANTISNGKYSVTNVKLGYRRLLGQKVEMHGYFGVDNLFDESYTSRANLNPRDGVTFLSPSPDRTVYGGLSLKYLF